MELGTQSLIWIKEQSGIIFLKLERGFKRNVAEEKRASGISPEHTKLDDALEEIIDKSKAAEEEWGKRMMMNE